MSAVTRAWVGAQWIRYRLKRRFRPIARREELIREYAPGRSVADMGAMWGINGGLSFLAEESGARSVTAVDIMSATDEFEATKARRRSQVRFVKGDLHDPATLEEVGVHDLVFSAGVLYHAPNPVHTLECLRQITRELFIVYIAGIPEVPGLGQACVFYPGLDRRGRRAWALAHSGSMLGITESGGDGGGAAIDADDRYGNWWWGITPSALRGMLGAARFEVIRSEALPFHTYAVARPR